MEMLHTFIIAFMAFFAITNPSSTLPIYLMITNHEDSVTAKSIAKQGCFIAFIIIAIFSLFGRVLFTLFGITQPALQITGGAIVFMIGLHMLQGTPSDVQRPASSDQKAAKSDSVNAAISPLATPMMAGPGCIATAINLSADKHIGHTVATILAYGALCLITYFIFLGGKPLIRLLGQNILNVITRLMGLILAVIGTQMMIEGLKTAFPLLDSITR